MKTYQITLGHAESRKGHCSNCQHIQLTVMVRATSKEEAIKKATEKLSVATRVAGLVVTLRLGEITERDVVEMS